MNISDPSAEMTLLGSEASLSVRDQLPQDALETDAARIGWIRSGPTFARPARRNARADLV
jgi:hypothetical protein